MCLAVPGRVLSVQGARARIDFSGIQRDALIDLLPEVTAGDYVLVHAGFVIQRLDPKEAEETAALLQEGMALRGQEEQTWPGQEESGPSGSTRRSPG